MEQSNIKSLTIAIDGFSSCGKSTFAKQIAARLGYTFIDTGAMYRAVALAALRRGVSERAEIIEMLPSLDITFRYNAERGASDVYLGKECVEPLIRTIEVSNTVSKISAIGEVRQKLVSLQQGYGQRGGIVMDGRDIGTVVFPTAEIKIYMTAEATIRAERRYNELLAKGQEYSFEEIKQNIIERDLADISREVSPLRQAIDAVVLDNSHMTLDEQMAWFDRLYKERVQC